MRTDMTSAIDGALAGRNLGSKGWWNCARSGNGNMMTDLSEEDGQDYDELEGIGETTEEMTAAESAAEDQGNTGAFKPYRDLVAGEVPPHAPSPGKAWIRRRIRTGTRAPGGKRLVKVRWAQVSPACYNQIRSQGKLMVGSGSSALQGLGITIDSNSLTWAALGGVAVFGALVLMKRRRRSTVTVG